MNTLRLLYLSLWAGITWAASFHEPYRPQFHFSPTKNWMNDPNGLLYHDGTYHLFFQHNPYGIQDGNISWGHATSHDLMHWEHQPIALLARGYPQNVTEMIFTGSAVADTNNTSGLGVDGKIPLIAIYTSAYQYAQDLPSGKSVKANQQSQSLAYSLDDGKTWSYYDALNPIIETPAAPYEDQWQNFRDPFAFWHDETQKWILVTALSDIHKLMIWTSDNLIDWTVASEFGPVNAVGGVWECPNLFPLPFKADKTGSKWVLVVGLNPGGPPGTVGSGTQYFIGDFNGTAFVPDADSAYPGNETANWMDWGPDWYAATAWNGLPEDDHVQLGWMNNWQYGSKIPTNPWRGAMAFPRHLSLKQDGEKAILLQWPHQNITELRGKERFRRSWSSLRNGVQDLGPQERLLDIELAFADQGKTTSGTSEAGIIVRATSDLKTQTRIGYDFDKKLMFVDRTKSGITDIDKTFPTIYHAPLTPDEHGIIKLRILLDWAGVEVFGGEGESTLTAQIFPFANATHVQVFSKDGSTDDVSLKISELTSIWS
ncbi:Extracellular exo-inulinase inuE [Penicillium chermesinum]|uniref:Extracellular exo-inulinase inuE n=1 Tax=Penicillium chermesinum TaxID=63820 RepID=A0A9W9P707_9EURO|nr:Extracellular exo-inulinase inuE [Penicillium chermesinum]KAJ5238800.1 Extracellular exo-inulinase inuE [Penicillium chermesinum]KAJ6164439.1 Extracellular exo-inulinase inuE [Penicillium chermesinum]